MRVRWLRSALQNLQDQMDYIALDNPAAAERLARQIFASVQQLSEHPSLGRPGRVSGTRELVVPGTPYVIPYRVRHEAVEILRVFHDARRWPGSL